MLRIARKSSRDVLITGGAGFLGAHLASHLLAGSDARITLYDDLADPGASENLAWLQGQAEAGRLKLVRGGLLSPARLARAASSADEIYHLAPFDPISGNLGTDENASREGTSNVLDAARRSARNPLVICASIGSEFRPQGVAPVDLASGGTPSPACTTLFRCSSSDRLVLDYGQLHRLPAVVLRIDTVTGPRQFGEGQDWVARMAYAIISGSPCILPGNPSQMHDVLHVSDAVQAIVAARAYIGKTAGKAYSVSGGSSRWVTVEDMIHLIERISHRPAKIVGTFMSGDPGSQPVAEDGSFQTDTCWRARRSLEETVRDISAFWHATQQSILSARQMRHVSARPARIQAA